MITIVADTHTHTLACDHAYSTIEENAAAAAKRGLRFLCMTEHGPTMTGAPSAIHFDNLKEIPRFLNGVLILKGAEVNILDYEGGLDLPDRILKKLEWVIASYHSITVQPASAKEHTAGWIAVANNPLVDVIGHCGDSRFAFEEEVVIREFAKTGKIVEINSHSFRYRPGSSDNCPRIAKLCAENGVSIVVSSDAHHYTRVGRFANAIAALEEMGFPQELILNGDYDRFLAAVRYTSGKELLDEE